MWNDVRMVFSDDRGTWNLFVDNEWYYEGNYEQVEKMFWTFFDEEE